MKELPTIEEAGAIAVEISEQVQEPLSANEQAFFVAGFQECVKYLSNQAAAPKENNWLYDMSDAEAKKNH